jgi:hypothetical protein
MLVYVVLTRRKENGKMDLRKIDCGKEKLMEIGACGRRVTEPSMWLFSCLIKLLHSVEYNR